MSEDPVTARMERLPRRRFQKWRRIVIGAVLYVAFALLIFPPKPFLIEAPVRLLIGWLFELPDLPPLPRSPSLETLLWTVAALAAVILIGHLIAKPRQPSLRLRDSAAFGLLAVLMTAGSIAVTGVGRHFSQLSKVTVIRDPRGLPDVTRTMIVCHYLDDALTDYLAKHGSYPTTLDDLPDFQKLLPSRYKSLAEPFVLLCPGKTPGKDQSQPVAVSPVYYWQDQLKIQVLRADHTTQQLPATELANILREFRKPSP
ncbi:hypothetical protein [Luteolibacter sp. LG18]|uniref:hypothetical protein n=1 Tax=Luteolibacter sp. LG18 TaxID=2819286 RepID=UPI002B31569D|nr:hypothetical protein llg_31950 [Luteolibacter sp. LG18]